MDKPTKIHFLLSGGLVLISILALVFGWSGLLSGLVVILINLYLFAILFEAAHRTATPREIKDGILQPKPVYYFSFPTKSWAMVLILFIVITTICGFANMYIDSKEIVYVGPNVEAATVNSEAKVYTPSPAIMKNKAEAIYFSLVTMITLGYGDFLPTSTNTRLLVIWQLATGGLFIMAIFPLIITRITDF
ncbi:MAG: ion channel [Thiohalomonadales bacterium]